MNKNFNSAFTLVESIVVLVVLGIVVALTIPQVVRRQIEAANRTKIKKSMQVFDFFMNKIVLENDIKSTKALEYWGKEGGECANQRKYFKLVKGDGCQFMTADKVWWDLTDITHPVIALKEGELDKPESKTTFTLLAHFGPSGELRVDDIQWELTSNKHLTHEEEKALKKLNAFVNNEKEEECNSSLCMWQKYAKPCPQNEYGFVNDEDLHECLDINPYIDGGGFNIYDADGITIVNFKNCTNPNDYTTCKKYDFYDHNSFGDNTIVRYNCNDLEGEDCESYDVNEYNPAGKLTIEKINCKKLGSECDEVNVYEYDDNNELIVEKYGCNDTGTKCDWCNGSWCGDD